MAWLFTIKLEYGIIGLGIASTITHLTIFLAQRYVIYHLDDLKEAMKVSIFDERNLNNMKEYMQMAIQTMCLLLFEIAVFDIQTTMTGFISVKSLTC